MIFEATPRKKRSGPQARALRRRLAEAQNWRCAWCRCSLEQETVTIDHVMALVLGGPDDWGNMVAACYACNQLRGHETMRYVSVVVMGERRKSRAERKRCRIKAQREAYRSREDDLAALVL